MNCRIDSNLISSLNLDMLKKQITCYLSSLSKWSFASLRDSRNLLNTSYKFEHESLLLASFGNHALHKPSLVPEPFSLLLSVEHFDS